MKDSILKKLCTVLYLVCGGDYWYEERKTLNFVKSLPYKFCWWLIYVGFVCLLVSELLSALFGDYTQNQRNDILSHAVPQIILMIKLSIFINNSEFIKKLNHDMIKVCREHEKESTLNAQNRRIKTFVSFYCVTVASVIIYIVTTAAIGVMKHGHPFVTLVSYWPKATDAHVSASILRVLIPVPWIVIMVPMVTSDLMAVTHLIMLAHKFITLRLYFYSIKEDFEGSEPNESNSKETMKRFRQLCLDGILMHQELLRLADCIRTAFGFMMSLQVCQSFATIVFLLMRFAFTHDTSLKLQLGVYVLTMLVMLAQYLWNAGDVTHEAYLLSDSIFHCGWHLFLYSGHGEVTSPFSFRGMHAPVSMGCVRAQRALVFRAFGVQNLSYDTFVSVVKATYSTFAVFAGR